MRINRRDFLGYAAAAPLFPTVAIGQEDRVLRAAGTQAQLAPDGYPATDVWAYDGTVPGRPLRLRQGETLSLAFQNDLPQEATIHWHGLRLDNAMDGVPGLTQDPVQPGDSFEYRVRAPDAGTFWYHPHANSVEQLARGLGGALIVEEPDRPDVDRDEVLFLNDWRLTDQAQIHDSFGNMHDKSHGGRIGNYMTVNGTGNLQIPVKAGERLRLRLVNAATDRIVQMLLDGMTGWVVAMDGMPLQKPEPVETLVLGPSQRVDIIVDVTAASGEDAFLVSVENGQGYVMTAFPVSTGTSARGTMPKALDPNPVSEPALAEAMSVPLLMEGGAMGALGRATYKGQNLSIGELYEQSQVWAFNGIVGRTEKPLADVPLGQTLRIPISNQTAFPHAMHLHGHHFREVLPDGSFGPLRDTILLGASESREIAFAADNPGNWMFHCHMLSHQAAGMATWIRVGANA